MPSRQRWCPPRRRSSAAQQAAEAHLEDDDAAANALGTMGCAPPNLSAEASLNEEPIMLQIAPTPVGAGCANGFWRERRYL